MADETLDTGGMGGDDGLASSSVDQSQQQAPPQALAQTIMGGMGNGMGPNVPQQPSAGVQATRRHGGLLTGLVGVLLDGLSAGVRTPQGPNGFAQSAQMAAQMPQQRQQQQMALQQQQMQFGTQQELQKAQIAQAHVQQLQARLMAASLDDEVASGMSDAAWKFAQNSIEQGTARSVSGLGSREAAFDKLKELHDSSSAEEQGNLFAFPSGKDKDGNQQWGVYQVFPNKTLQEDTKFHLDGDPDNGIPDIDKTYPAGTPMSVYTTDTSQLTRDLIAKHHTVAMMNKPDPTKVITGVKNGQPENQLLNTRTKEVTNVGQSGQGVIAQQKADRSDAKQAQKDTKDTVYGFDQNANEQVMTNRADAEARGLQGIYSVKAGDIEKDRGAIRQLGDVQLNTSRYRMAAQAYAGLPASTRVDDQLKLHDLLNKAGAFDFDFSVSEGGHVKLPLISALVEGLNRQQKSDAYAGLSKQGKDLYDAYLRTMASVPAYQKALTNIGKANKEMMELELANVPNPSLEAADQARKLDQFQENIDRATTGFPRMPGLPMPKDIRASVEGQSSGGSKFVSREDATKVRQMLDQMLGPRSPAPQ